MVLCTPHQVAKPLLLLLCSLRLDGQSDFFALLQSHDVHLLVVSNLNTGLLQIKPQLVTRGFDTNFLRASIPCQWEASSKDPARRSSLSKPTQTV